MCRQIAQFWGLVSQVAGLCIISIDCVVVGGRAYLVIVKLHNYRS